MQAINLASIYISLRSGQTMHEICKQAGMKSSENFRPCDPHQGSEIIAHGHAKQSERRTPAGKLSFGRHEKIQKFFPHRKNRTFSVLHRNYTRVPSIEWQP